MTFFVFTGLFLSDLFSNKQLKNSINLTPGKKNFRAIALSFLIESSADSGLSNLTNLRFEAGRLNFLVHYYDLGKKTCVLEWVLEKSKL